MTWFPIAFLPSQYSDNAGAPYSGAVLKAYAEGTTNNIQMATNTNGDGPANSFALNASGYPVSATNAVIIPHIQEDYKLALYPDQASADADSGALWTIDGIEIADPVSTAFLEKFSGDGVTEDFTLSEDLGDDEKTLMVFADRSIDYVTTGDFAEDANWTKGTGWTIASGVATATGAISTDLEQNANQILTEGESYTITFTVANQSAGGVIPKIGGISGTERTANGTYTETIIAGSTQVIAIEGNGYTGDVDNISVKRVNSSRREVLRDDEFTLDGTNLNIPGPVPSGTNNILVFAPSLLLGVAGGSAANAAISEANALSHANDAQAAQTATEAARDQALAAVTGGIVIEKFVAGDEMNAGEFTPGVTTSLTLGADPLNEGNVHVFFGAGAQHNWNLSGTTLTFRNLADTADAAIPVEVEAVYVRRGVTMSLAEVGDGTLSFAKLASTALGNFADLLAGTASKLVDAATFKSWHDQMLGFTVGYQESAEISMATGDQNYTFNHTLGVVPKLSQTVLRCKIAEQGFAVGDEVPVTNDNDRSNATYTANVFCNATEITLLQNSSFPLTVRTAGNPAEVITFANWVVVHRVWA